MFSTSVSGEKMKNNKVATAGVSLSEGYALSEQYLLSKTIAGEENLEENLPRMHALSAPSACPASHLSLLAPNALDSLSQKSLTCA